MHRRHNGFTLLELLAAIAIVVILVGMLAFGGRSVINSGKERTTRGTLGNLLGMVTEYDLAGAKRAEAPSTGMPAVIGGPYPVPKAVLLDVREGWSDQERHAILLTRSYLSLFRRVPANADAFGRLPADQIVKLSLGTLPPPSDWADATFYRALDRAVYPPDGGIDVFLVTKSHTSAFDVNSPKEGSAPWVPEDQDGVDVLDGWDNPILLGLPGGLEGITIEGVEPWMSGGAYTRGQIRSVPGPDGRMWAYECLMDHTADGDNAPDPMDDPDDQAWRSFWGGIGATGGRPFFASAGPDGDFSKGDDNVYSFEN